MLFKNILHTLILFISLTASSSIYAEEKSPALEKQVQNLKQEVLDLNKELFILEEDLLFPATLNLVCFYQWILASYLLLILCK